MKISHTPFKFVLGAFLAVLLGSGCTSSGSAVFSQRDPIALVSFVSNADINWKGEDPVKPGTLAVLTGRALRQNPDNTVVTGADEVLDAAELLFRTTMAGSVQINLAEKEMVLNSSAYRNARLNQYPNRDMASAGDYSFIDYRDKNFSSALAAETGIQRSMYLEFNLDKNVTKGIAKNGNLWANVEMKVRILDAQGKTLYYKIIKSQSPDSIKVSNWVYSQSGFIALVESAMEDVYREFLYTISK